MTPFVAAAIVAFFIGLSCGRDHEPKDPATAELVEALRAKYRDAKERAAGHLAEDLPWIAPMDCDGMLWNGMACAVGIPVDLSLAMDGNNDAHRRPFPPACWDKEKGDLGAGATFSNDMAIGKLWCHWRARDQAALEKWAGRLEGRNFVMGEPWPEEAGRLVLSVNGQGILGRILFGLSRGQIDKSYRRLFRAYFPAEKDHERHVQALSIALQGEVSEGLRENSLDATVQDAENPELSLLDINDQMKTRLADLVHSEPQNPLFHAANGVYSGDFTQAIALLLDEKTPIPSYVRGGNPAAFALIEWLFAADLVLRRYPKETK